MTVLIEKISLHRWQWFAVPLLLIIAALIGIYHYKVDALLWHLLQTRVMQGNSLQSSLNLDNYRVKIEAKPITGIEDDASGLTYNLETNTLFSVLNGTPLVIELDLEGNLLRKIHIDGIRDMEGITHVDGNRYVVADEYDQRLILIEIDKDTEKLDISRAPQISLGVDAGNNKGFEGVSWDEQNNRLIVVKERNPLRILEITGFVDDSTTSNGLRVSQIAPSRFSAFQLRDLSSVSYHDESGHLVLLSDESRIAAEYDLEGRVVSILSLWRGFHGLQKNVPQAEGIAIGPDRRIYIVSEPNLFYAFSPEDRGVTGF
ncbi:putative protein YjiK [Methylophilaceae bacterium]|nr:putative protein YjiK [Methylophilaceae bacterium]